MRQEEATGGWWALGWMEVLLQVFPLCQRFHIDALCPVTLLSALLDLAV